MGLVTVNFHLETDMQVASNRAWAVQWPPLTVGGGIAAGVFLVQYTLYYKKRQELQLAQAAFPQGGPENILQ